MSESLRGARERLVADRTSRGAAFGQALAALVDDFLVRASREWRGDPSWAIVALGSFARRELCPGSDVDVMLLHAGGRRGMPGADRAAALWYPLWDAGFTLGQSVRSVKEAVAAADDDLDTLTALLDVRLVAGEAPLVDDLVERVRLLAPRRRDRLVGALAAAAEQRALRPGPIAEMLEPDLKLGAGGLRDVQCPGWVGWTLPAVHGAPGVHDGRGWEAGVAVLVERGYLEPGDPERLCQARTLLLDARVALHRVTGSRSDRLPLQEQDAVSRVVGATDADALVRALGAASRAVEWITRDLWARLRAAESGPGSRGSGTRQLGDGVVLRDDRVAVESGVMVDTTLVLRAAAHAATLRVPFERPTLARFEHLDEVVWDSDARDAFLALLGAGRGAIPVFESLDHVGLLTRLLPEWEHVRALPQRNAYHRFTVDRHSLEAVAECAALLDPESPSGDGFDGDVARRARSDVLLLAALLHDIAKGRPGDHSVAGANIARAVARRIGLDARGTESLVWVVRDHLLLADTATRRDLSDERTITRFADAVADPERNALLYALTIGDSRATGPAAWNASKAALVLELFVKTDRHLGGATTMPDDRGDPHRELAAIIGDGAAAEYLAAMPAAYVRMFSAAELAHHRDLVAAGRRVVEWAKLPDDRVRAIMVAPDRTGLLATAAAALALVGFDIDAASASSTGDGIALEIFTGRDRFGRLSSAEHRARATDTILAALDGTIDLDTLLRERTHRYRPTTLQRADRDVRVLVDTEASERATVVEVHAPDDIGLLARVASVFVELDLDIEQAIVSTVGDRVVDVFYLRDTTGTRFVQRHAVASLRATLLSRLTAAVTLDERRAPDG